MIFKITKKSIRQFQFGETEPTISLDVIEVSDAWHEINFALREGADFSIPTNKVNEYCINRLNFVQSIVNDAYAAQHPTAVAPTLSRIEAEEFIRVVREETDSLRNFISAKTEESLSVPENTEQVNFSQ